MFWGHSPLHMYVPFPRPPDKRAKSPYSSVFKFITFKAQIQYSVSHKNERQNLTYCTKNYQSDLHNIQKSGLLPSSASSQARKRRFIRSLIATQVSLYARPLPKEILADTALWDMDLSDMAGTGKM